MPAKWNIWAQCKALGQGRSKQFLGVNLHVKPILGGDEEVHMIDQCFSFDDDDTSVQVSLQQN